MQDAGGSGVQPRCSEVAEKLQRLFGWRHTYDVQRRQKGLTPRHHTLTTTISSPPPATAGDAWVCVHNLRSQAGGGILDPDDRLLDVVDDREQIVASFDGGGIGGGGDGASAAGSSVGTASPDMFQGDGDGDVDDGGRFAAIEVPGGAPPPPPSLQVRRGSEPALHQLGTTEGGPGAAIGGVTPGSSNTMASSGSKRWSATPAVPPPPPNNTNEEGQHTVQSSNSNANSRLRVPPVRKEVRRGASPEWRDLEPRLTRDGGGTRLSMQFTADARWADAADRVASRSLPRDVRSRKEPLGQATASPPKNSVIRPLDSDDELAAESAELVVLRAESGPLGIHVVPEYDERGRDRGLLVQGVEPGGRVARDGRLAPNDRIIEINGRSLLRLPFHRVQEIFKDSLQSPELRLRVVRHEPSTGSCEAPRKPPAPIFPRSLNNALRDRDAAMVEGEERVSVGTKVATVSPTKKVSSTPAATGPVVGAGIAAGAGVRQAPGSTLMAANTRRIGRKIELELMKGSHGLGFSITTRDNPAGGNCPIYIKNILPKGAAVEDGRLRPGDRLLEVNGVQMTGKTQAEAVAVLRDAVPGSTVRIVVSRQEDVTSPAPLPRQIVEEQPTQSRERPGTTVSRDDSTHESIMATATPAAVRQPPEKANDDGLVFPWKHKEILTFDIPVHDSEKAGLGVSVKGKTTAGHGSTSGSTDLGIFVKSVLHGGAASRDGRLRTNDQLLSVNGVSLLEQSNSDAMETLRRAMLHLEGPVPGAITLTVARNTSAQVHTPNTSSGRDSANSLLTSSSGTETFGGKNELEAYNLENSGTSENSENNTVIFLPYTNKDDESQDSSNRNSKTTNDDAKHKGTLDAMNIRHPVIDRLTGQIPNPHALRNESYYRATNDTWNTTMMLSGTTGDKLVSPTVNPPAGEMVMIEEEYTPPPHRPEANRHRLDKPPDQGRQAPDSRGRQPSENGSGEPAYSSQLSLEEAAAGFSRDAFGRQSMSEKRHATLDAKHTDTYQRNKKLREERERQRHMQQQQQQLNDLKKTDHDHMLGAEAKLNREINGLTLVRANSVESVVSLTRSQADSEKSDARARKDFGPSLGMKKSSSLESLQTMVQEIQMQEEGDPAYTYRNAQGAVRVVRGRGCNESFRAAVDRSYEAPLADVRAHALNMETLAEEEGQGSECGVTRGGPRQSSLNAVLDGKHKPGSIAAKKKPRLLKGIGSMFRFGKHRKTLDAPLQLCGEDGASSMIRNVGENDGVGTGGEREAARRAAQEEQRRIQEQYQRLVQRQRQQEVARQHQNPPQQTAEHGGEDHHREGSSSSSSDPSTQSQSRTERIHQLRAQHQRRHAERRGQYPLDDREERYEEVIRQQVDRPDATSHSRSASYDLYGEMARPGSRTAITDPARFSHYVNYEEIQQHLNKRKEQLSEVQIMQMRLQVQHQRFKVEEESRRQQHYHSQRRDNREHHQRPASNFYEYESVQAVMRATQQLRGGGVALSVDANSNSLPRGRRMDGFGANVNEVAITTNGIGGGGSNYRHRYGPVPNEIVTVNRWTSRHPHEGSRGSEGAPSQTRSQGPFVTQVTIGQQPPTGYKV